MLKISKLADYGTIIASFLAKSPGERFSASLIAEQTHIPAPTVSKVLKRLSQHNLVTSVQGANGGYYLTRAADAISLVELVAAIDGSPALTECSQSNNCCTQDAHCSLRSNWQFINNLVLDVLRDITLADMLKPLALPLRFHSPLLEINKKDEL